MNETIGVTTAVKFNAKTSNAHIIQHEIGSRNDSTNNENSQNECENSSVPSSLQVYCHMFMLCISILTYCSDLVFAALIAYFYFTQGRVTFFVLTIVFIAVPILTTTAFSMRWYLIDEDNYQIARPSIIRWIIRIILLLLQMVQILRYGETIFYNIKFLVLRKTNNNEKQQHVYRKMLDEYCNSALLRLFHCFLHAAPQAVLHLLLLFQHLWTTEKTAKLGRTLIILQCGGCLNWIISIAWGLTAYYRAVRVVREDKENLTCCNTFILFLWNLLSIASRLLALSILASVIPPWFGAVCVLHWFVMASWLAFGHVQTTVCTNRCEELILSAMLGYAYITAFIATRDGPTRYSYLVYYLVCLMENTGALVVWCVENSSATNPRLYYGAVGAQLSTFFLGLLFMLLYYTKLHPSSSTVSLKHCSDYAVDDDALNKPSFSKN